jgi:hypothetical protein
MSSEIALLNQGRALGGWARDVGEQRRRWAVMGALLLACACGGSESSASTPTLPSAPPDAGSVAPATPPASSDATASDAGALAPTPSELPAAAPAQPEPADDPPASNGPAPEVDLELACTDGAEPICLDDGRVVVCQGGQPIQTSCDTLCEIYGLNPGPCDGGCQCGEPSSPECDLAAEDFCACSALVGSGECTPETRERLYLGCYVNGIAGELMACTAEFRAARPDAPIDEAFCTALNETCT